MSTVFTMKLLNALLITKAKGECPGVDCANCPVEDQLDLPEINCCRKLAYDISLEYCEKHCTPEEMLELLL